MKNVFREVLQGIRNLAIAAAVAACGSSLQGQNYPDLSVVVPLNQFSIVQTSTAREFRYTHQTYNGGSGPLEIQPFYNPASGSYQGNQRIYNRVSNSWQLVQTIPVAGAFVFHAAHGHFHYPLTSFGLYTVAPGGGIGAPVATSPKNGFCIADSFLYNASLPNAGAFGNWGSCSDPTSTRGLSIGAVDEYNYLDPGQSIPIDGLPDGTYWFRAIADPLNFLAESNKSNNETDVKVTITGNTVQVLQSVVPVLTPPPVINITSPVSGSTVFGTVNLTTSIAGVQFLIDGQPLGAAVLGSSKTWDTTTVPAGTHWLAAQTTDSNGRTGTSPVVIVTVSNGPPGPSGTLRIDSSVSVDGSGNRSVPVTTLNPNDILLAFVSAGGAAGSPQTATVSGAGLAWTLVQRSNLQRGTAEIWTAKATNPLSSATVTSTLANTGNTQSLTVVAFSGASGVGASAISGAPGGSPQVGLISTAAGSWTFGLGNDGDSATARITGQTMVHQFLGSANTFWVQSQLAPVASAGVSVTISDIGPTLDSWNLAAVEVLPAAPPEPDTTPPTVQVTNPENGSTVAGIITVSATASDNQSGVSVNFFVDNAPLGGAVISPPFTTTWDTKTAAPGSHVVTASATDSSNNVGNSVPVTVTVDNSRGPNLIGKDATVFLDGQGTMTTPAFSTVTPGDLLVAFVAYDGPASPQTATVSGAGLTWSLVIRSNVQKGTSEIWAAKATGLLSGVTVTSQPGTGSYHGSMTVIAFTNATGTGIVGQSSAPTGAPDIYLPGITAGNWVFAVGNDWDNSVAGTPVSGQVLVHQRVDTQVGDTFWVQSTTAPSTIDGVVTIHDNAPTTDQWNYAAVEIVATRSVSTYSISGSISPAQSGVLMTLTGGPGGTATTNAQGGYSFAGLAAGTYTVTPTKTGFTFNPSSLTLTITNANLTADFTAIPVPTYTISGNITGAISVLITRTGASGATATTDSQGGYSFGGLAPGTYTVTPTKTGFTFNPSSLTLTMTNANLTADFTASPIPTYTISGTITGATSVLVTRTGVSGATATTDPQGGYSFGSLAPGTYTVTPTKAGFMFAPPSVTVTITDADMVADFNATPVPTYTISGTITGASSVLITRTGASSATATTDSQGLYSFGGLAPGTYTVTPSKAGFTFAPPSVTVTITNTNMLADFSATPIPTYTISGTIGPLPDGSVVLVTRSGSPGGTATTDALGNYSFAGLANGTYTITPSKAGFTFNPANRTIVINNGNMTADFIASLVVTATPIAIDANVSRDGAAASSTIVSPAFSTTSGNELLLAFVATDASGSGTNTTVTNITGGGLTWALVVRTNVQRGTSEIWRAFGPSPLTNATVTATLSQGVASMLTVMSFKGVDPSGANGSGAIGAIQSANAASGAPTATLVTTRNNSWVVGVGNDYDKPIARTVGAGQSLVHQYMPPVGDTYWVQMRNGSVPTGGTGVTINDTAPTGDRYNLSICEIRPAP